MLLERRIHLDDNALLPRVTRLPSHHCDAGLETSHKCGSPSKQRHWRQLFLCRLCLCRLRARRKHVGAHVTLRERSTGGRARKAPAATRPLRLPAAFPLGDKAGISYSRTFGLWLGNAVIVRHHGRLSHLRPDFVLPGGLRQARLTPANSQGSSIVASFLQPTLLPPLRDVRADPPSPPTQWALWQGCFVALAAGPPPGREALDQNKEKLTFMNSDSTTAMYKH